MVLVLGSLQVALLEAKSPAVVHVQKLDIRDSSSKTEPEQNGEDRSRDAPVRGEATSIKTNELL